MSDELNLDVEVRKIVTVIDEVHTEGGRGDEGGPLKKVAVAVVFRNPYAGKPFTEDLSELVKASAGLGKLIGERVNEAIGGQVESHGKAVVVGTAGEQEHGNAAKTTEFGNPFREGFGGGKAWLPRPPSAAVRERPWTCPSVTRTRSGSVPTTTRSRSRSRMPPPPTRSC